MISFCFLWLSLWLLSWSSTSWRVSAVTATTTTSTRSAKEVNPLHDPNKPCVGPTTAKGKYLNAPFCDRDNTHCGEWDVQTRTFYPNHCAYRDISLPKARQCLANRVIGCVGDSQIRDLCMGLAMFLFGTSKYELPREKLEKRAHRDYLNISIISVANKQIPEEHGRAIIIPSLDTPYDKVGNSWQIQIWDMAHVISLERFIPPVLNNSYLTTATIEKIKGKQIRKVQKIDLAIWNLGLHNSANVWDHPSQAIGKRGERYYDNFVKNWIKFRAMAQFPTVYMSMNNQPRNFTLPHLKPEECYRQQQRVEDANRYMHTRLRSEKLPYYDASSVLRSPQREQLNADLSHVQMWVDNVRANILLNHLCDEDGHWIGSEQSFVF